MIQKEISLPKMLRGQDISAKAVAVRNRLVRRVVMLLLIVTLVALFCVWSRVKIVQMGYHVSELQSKNAELTKQSDHLLVEIERLKSPTRLQKVATTVLGMHPPSSSEMIFVKKEKNTIGQ